jgi:hypothetical protein
LIGDVPSKETFMTRWIGAAVLAFTLMFSGSAAIHSAAAASRQAAVQKQEASQATDLSARRRIRRYAYRPHYRPTYDDRPEYYRPYPYVVPAPFPFGLGFGPWW